MQALNLSGKRQGSIRTIFNLWFQSGGENSNSNKLFNMVGHIEKWYPEKSTVILHMRQIMIHSTSSKFSIFLLYQHSEYFGYCWFEHAWFSSHKILLLIVACICLQILCSSIDRVFSHKTGMFEAQNYKELKPFSAPQLVTNFLTHTLFIHVRLLFFVGRVSLWRGRKIYKRFSANSCIYANSFVQYPY